MLQIMIETILFDMDGTLTNTMILQPLLVRKMLTNNELPLKEVQKRLAVIYYLNRFTWFKLQSFPLFVQQFKISYWRLFFKMPLIVVQYLRAIRTERLFSGVDQYLKKLKDCGYRIGLVTNGKSFEVKIKVSSIVHHFDVIVTSSDVSKKKPDPEMIIKGIKLLNSTPEKTLYVGDTLVDMLASKRAKVRFALMETGTFGPSVVKIGKHKPQYIFKNLEQLTIWLLKLKKCN